MGQNKRISSVTQGNLSLADEAVMNDVWLKRGWQNLDLLITSLKWTYICH